MLRSVATQRNSAVIPCASVSAASRLQCRLIPGCEERPFRIAHTAAAESHWMFFFPPFPQIQGCHRQENFKMKHADNFEIGGWGGREHNIHFFLVKFRTGGN